MEAATALFGDRGYHGTSIRDIAERTGILSGSLYAHIRTKEDLLYEIVAGAAAQFIGGLERVLDSRASPEEKLRDAMRSHVRVLADNLEGARVFHHEWRALTASRREEIAALRDRYEEMWDEVLRDLRPVGSRFARLLALSAANWTYVWYDPAGSMSPEEVADRFSELLLHGVKPSATGKEGKRKSERGATR